MKKILLLLLIISATLALHACQNKTFPTSVELQDVHTNIDNYYQIFIRSFADSNHDGIGDLKGIENNLDYLETLGVTALWLSPFHPSNTYHGYAVTDYYDVHEDFGTLEDLQSLIDAAKSRNMDIMMDLVINHSSGQHPWYIDARSNMDSPYRDYYFWDAPNVAYQSFV
ncbi:MAG: alpha-amylase family glycosyl hydrolase, partial [Acholeplasmataceae bacterium]